MGVKASDYYSTVDTRWLCRQNAAVEAHSHLDKCAFKKIQFAVLYDRQMRKAIESTFSNNKGWTIWHHQGKGSRRDFLSLTKVLLSGTFSQISQIKILPFTQLGCRFAFASNHNPFWDSENSINLRIICSGFFRDKNRWETTNSRTPGPCSETGSSSQIIFITLFFGRCWTLLWHSPVSATSAKVGWRKVKTCEFGSVKWFWNVLTFLHPILICRFTHLAQVEGF
jgi:hypothetical protein